MDNKIEVFKNEQFGEVRTILDGETLLFCGSDVARALGYARPGKAIIDHCKGVLKRDTLTSGGTQSLSYITEGDVYRLSIPKDEYELMIDDLLTMSEIIQCVADMRTQDVKAIREFGKFVPAFAAFEKNRLSLYREAAKEAEEIFDRWADEIDDLDKDFMEDEDYEPDEYYSD